MAAPIIALFIPIIAIVLVMGLAMLFVYLGYRKKRELFNLYHQERMLALEKGLEVPPLPEGLLEESATPYNPRRHLLIGMVWLFAGVGIGLGLWSVADHEGAHYSLFSLILVGIGAAHLIYYWIEGRKDAETGRQRAPEQVGARG